MPYDGDGHLLRRNRTSPTAELGTSYNRDGHALRRNRTPPTTEMDMPYDGIAAPCYLGFRFSELLEKDAQPAVGSEHGFKA